MSKKRAELPTFKEVYENTIRGLKLRRGTDESMAAFRDRVDAAIAARWNCAPSTLLAFKNGRRRPTPKKNPKFYDDLQRFGRAEFDERGTVKRDTLGAGPDPFEWFNATPAGSDRRVSERAVAP